MENEKKKKMKYINVNSEACLMCSLIFYEEENISERKYANSEEGRKKRKMPKRHEGDEEENMKMHA